MWPIVGSCGQNVVKKNKLHPIDEVQLIFVYCNHIR